MIINILLNVKYSKDIKEGNNKANNGSEKIYIHIGQEWLREKKSLKEGS